MIRIFKHNSPYLDLKRWNEIVGRSANGLVYSYSWYLEALNVEWLALIKDDYDYIMALPIQRKWGIIPIIYQPLLVQQLGIITIKSNIDQIIIQEFISAIPWWYLKIYFHFNFNNKNLPENRFVYEERINFILDLNSSYETIKKNYNRDATRNIKKQSNPEFQFREYIDIEKVLLIYLEMLKTTDANLKSKEVIQLKNLIIFLAHNKHAYQLNLLHNKSIVAFAFCAIDHKRMYYILGAADENKVDKAIMHLVLDELFKRKAESNLIFDFEGSNLPGVAAFFRKFGAINQNYFLAHKRIFI